MSPSGVGHSYNMCRHLAVLAYLVRVRERVRDRERATASSSINDVSQFIWFVQ